MRLILFVNPKSGRGKSREISEKMAQRLMDQGHQLSIIIAKSVEESLQELERAIAVFPPDRVIAIGGDGQLHQAIQILNQKKIPLEVLPAGTGNDFATGHNFTKRIPQISSESGSKDIDLGLVSFGKKQRYFGQILSTGFDSLVNERANRMRFIRGRAKYTIATLIELPKFRPIPYRLTIDGKRRTLDATLVAIGNGSSYGGGMKLIPSAKSDDGLLDLFILHGVSRFELLRVFPKIFSGRHISHPAVEVIRAKRVIIDAPVLVYADGEFITEGRIEVGIAPKALRLVAKA